MEQGSQSEWLAGKVIDLMLDVVCVVDAKGRFIFVSAACERVFGYAPEEMIGREMMDFVFEADRERTLGTARAVMRGEATSNFENRYVRRDGQVIDIMWTARWSEADGVRIGVARDVTLRKRAEAMQAALYAISEAAHSASDLSMLFKQVHGIIAALLPAENLFLALYDEGTEEISFPYHVDQHDPPPGNMRLDAGTLSAEVIRSGQPLLVTPETVQDLPAAARAAVGTDSLYWLGVPLTLGQRTLGALVVQSYSGSTRYSDQHRELLQFVSTQVATAIERTRLVSRLQHVALYDHLTELPNRKLLHDRLGTALARARREDGGLAVMYMDLDCFKQVNDRLGHAAGDQLLQLVAERLRHAVRESDTVARLGGDEFVVMLEGVDLPQQALAVAEKIRAALALPLAVAGEVLQVESSIGVAMYPEHGDSEEKLLRHADQAMYLAKQHGGSQCWLAGLSDTRDPGLHATQSVY